MKKYLGIILILISVLIGKVIYAQTNVVVFSLDNETKKILKETTADSWFKKDAFTSTLLGGSIAIIAAWLAYFWQLRKERQSDEEFNFRVLDAIQTELKTVLDAFNVDTHTKLKDLKEGEIFPYWTHITQRHFVIYESNVSHIGKIDSELAKQLIKIHELVKILIENLGINSRYVMDKDQIDWALIQKPDDQNLLARKKWIESLMIAAAKDMKRQIDRIYNEAEILFKCFNDLKEQRSSK